jgi:hypothetical protein
LHSLIFIPKIIWIILRNRGSNIQYFLKWWHEIWWSHVHVSKTWDHCFTVTKWFTTRSLHYLQWRRTKKSKNHSSHQDLGHYLGANYLAFTPWIFVVEANFSFSILVKQSFKLMPVRMCIVLHTKSSCGQEFSYLLSRKIFKILSSLT